MLRIYRLTGFVLGGTEIPNLKSCTTLPLTNAGKFARAAFYYFFAVKNNLGIFRMTFPSP